VDTVGRLVEVTVDGWQEERDMGRTHVGCSEHPFALGAELDGDSREACRYERCWSGCCVVCRLGHCRVGDSNVMLIGCLTRLSLRLLG
jgi:hypothetical protein